MVLFFLVGKETYCFMFIVYWCIKHRSVCVRLICLCLYSMFPCVVCLYVCSTSVDNSLKKNWHSTGCSSRKCVCWCLYGMFPCVVCLYECSTSVDNSWTEIWHTAGCSGRKCVCWCKHHPQLSVAQHELGHSHVRHMLW